MIFLLLTVTGSALAQDREDSSFSLLINTGLSFTHADDPHINRWLEKYGYPSEPHVPTSYNFEIAAIPAASHLLYSVKLSTITDGKNLTSFNISAGLYRKLFDKKGFLLYAGGAVGYHGDIITLNGNLPPDYEALATQVHGSLALRRTGLFIEPALRAFWYPLRLHNWQIGFYGGLGYNMDLNSHWTLGYYNNNHGQYGHFRQLKRPTDQQKVSEYGFSLSAGLSIRINLH